MAAGNACCWCAGLLVCRCRWHRLIAAFRLLFGGKEEARWGGCAMLAAFVTGSVPRLASPQWTSAPPLFAGEFLAPAAKPMAPPCEACEACTRRRFECFAGRSGGVVEPVLVAVLACALVLSAALSLLPAAATVPVPVPEHNRQRAEPTHITEKHQQQKHTGEQQKSVRRHAPRLPPHAR